MKSLNDYNGNALVFTKPEDQVNNALYCSIITEVVVKQDQFHSMGQGNFYPKKELTNQIGHACGIEFLPNVRIETVYGDEVKGADGNWRRETAGIRCVKQGQKRKPDGTWQRSSPCAYTFNWKDRAELEMGDKSYTPKQLRRKELELKKFADQRASTGAELMVIRELTGMPTAFKKPSIDKGLMVFSQVGKSDALQKAEAQAVIQNIRSGGAIGEQMAEASTMLTGGSQGFDDHFQRPDAEPDYSAENTVEQPKESTSFESYAEKKEKTKKDLFEEYFSQLSELDQAGMKQILDDSIDGFKDKADADAFYTWAIEQMKGKIG